MITLQQIKCNNSRTNKPFINFDGPVTFEDNTLYFIIGDSGVGKSTLLDFFTSPFTEDPVKHGLIHFDNPTVCPYSQLSKKKYPKYEINFSQSFHRAEYFSFLKKHLAYIPQRTGSFHPSKPLARQLYEQYSWAAENPTKEEFCDKIQTLGKKAGFVEVAVQPDLKHIHIVDSKNYTDNATNEPYEIIKIDREVTSLNDEGLSTGQLQRLLVLGALIRFSVIENPILFGDEFLVNFSFTEGDMVLRSIIREFAEKKHKTGCFIFHDLSYPCIEELKDDSGINAVIMLFSEKGKTENGAKDIAVSRISVKDFWSDDLAETSAFFKFKKSYRMEPQDIGDRIPANSGSAGEPLVERIFPPFRYPKKEKTVYERLRFDIRPGRFIVLTGFSGCGKTTFCGYLTETHIPNKKLFRYFPSTPHESLSYDSHVTVEQDLQTIYGYYNGKTVQNLRDSGTAELLLRHFKDVQLFSEEKTLADYYAFLDKHVYDLSGGELQRYWFARITLFQKDNAEQEKPRLLIFDESISSLDCTIKDELLKYIIKDLFISQGLTVLFITHDLRDIGVIHNTLGNNKTIDRFEHYEMFNKQIYRVQYDNYEQYRHAVFNGGAVTYEFTAIDGTVEKKVLRRA